MSAFTVPAPSQPNYFVTAAKVAAATVGVLSAAGVSYALYFDYKRRNDPVFRKKLLKQKKKVAITQNKQQEQGKGQIQQALRRAIQLVNAEQVPESAEGKEQFFMEQVALGEQLAARSPEFYVASAISFYKALKVYPSPQELLMIYQKTQPAPVFDLVMELISLEIQDAQAAGAQFGGGAPPRSEDPLLEEIEAGEKEAEEEEEEEEEIVVGGSAASSGAKSVSSDGASPSSGNSSFVHVPSGAEVEETAEKVIDSAEEVVAEVVAKVEEAVESVEEKKDEVVEEAAEKIEEAKVEDPEEPVLAA